MSRRLALAASAMLAFATPALAQEAPAAPPAAVQEVDPAEAALQARGEAFGERMQAMAGEMQAAMTESAGDQARANALLDAIVARYQPEADSLATELETFLNHMAATSTDEAKKAELAAGGPAAVAAIRGVPAMVRMQVQQAAAPASTSPAP